MNTNHWRRIRNRIGFVVFVFGVVAAIAQPQAPITWGQGRWFGKAQIGGYLFPQGDTIVYSTLDLYMLTGIGTGYFGVGQSFDNGNTCGSWRRVDPADRYTNVLCLAATGPRAFAFMCGTDQIADGWARYSNDYGQTWGQLLTTESGFPTSVFSTDSVVAVAGSDGRTWFSVSTDRGLNWQYRQRIIDTADVTVPPVGIGLTHSKILVLGEDNVGDPRELSYAVGDRLTGQWQPFVRLPQEPGLHLCGVGVAADTSSELAMVVSIWEHPYGSGSTSLWLHRTTDGGQNWDGARCLEDTAYAPTEFTYFDPVMFHQGKLWAFAWRMSLNPDTSQRGMYFLFSANHGRNWYARRKIDDRRWDAYSSTGQFISNNEIRVYWKAACDTSVSRIYMDIRIVSGILNPDTAVPVIQPTVLPPDTVPIGAQQLFLANVTENDTLSRVELKVRNADSVSTIPMSWTGTDYTTTWAVPRAGRYQYRIEAEDWWENVGSYPDSGWVAIVTQGWIDAVDPVTLHPSAFILSASPNPFNPTTTISYSLPVESKVRLEVFDVTGRKTGGLLSAPTGVVPAGNHSIIFDGTGLASGIYFARIEAGGTAKIQKMVLVK